MSRMYRIQSGDTLGSIAREFYNDGNLYDELAKYNGILNPNLIFVGQILEIPSKSELINRPEPPDPGLIELAPPHGLQEIYDTFGDITKYIKADGTISQRWETEKLTATTIPFSIPLSWKLDQKTSKISCHKKLKKIITAVFTKIEDEGLKDEVKTYGGCYCFRPIRGGVKFSTHSWGIAIDLNPNTNPMGSKGDMNPDIVTIFRQYGFKWGGDWAGRRKDPMHFQFCTGY